MKKAKHKFVRFRDKLAFFAEVELHVESSDKFEIHFECSGAGFVGQGYFEAVPKIGYDEWKAGARKGIEYAAKHAAIKNCLVTVTEIQGVTTDTNPVIIAGASAFAFWEAIGFEPKADLKEKIDEKVFSSWQNKKEFFE